MEKKYKLRKLVKKNCEGIILSILQFSGKLKFIPAEDNRVDLFRRFLGIGEDKLNHFILDIFLTLLKGN